jgi:hypothetical protein
LKSRSITLEVIHDRGSEQIAICCHELHECTPKRYERPQSHRDNVVEQRITKGFRP